jgi:hypothetical protein
MTADIERKDAEALSEMPRETVHGHLLARGLRRGRHGTAFLKSRTGPQSCQRSGPAVPMINPNEGGAR